MKKYILLMIMPLVFLWFLTKLWDVIFDKLFGWSYTLFGLFLFVLILYYLGCVVWLLIKIGSSLFKSLKENRITNRYVIITSLIFTVITLDLFFDPLSLEQNLDRDKGVLLRSYYAGQLGGADLFFLDNGTFNSISYNLFSKDRGIQGTYWHHKDTLFLKPETKLSITLSDTLFVRGDYLYRPARGDEYKFYKDSIATTHFRILENRLD